MFTNSLLAGLALAATASAQTWTACNPLLTTCPSQPALGNEKINCVFNNENTLENCPGFTHDGGTTLAYNTEGALFTIDAPGQAPTIMTHKYILFGRVEVELQAAPGVGVVTAFVLQSADLDEIDWEWLGGDNLQVQSNYFGKGDVSTYDRGAFHEVTDPINTSHKYAIEWTKEKVDWIINGKVVRTLAYADAQGGARFPQTPMEIKLGTWVAGTPEASPGTVAWAGGMTQFEQGPFTAVYKSVSVVDYAGGSAPATEAVTSYTYGDNSGSWESIQIAK